MAGWNGLSLAVATKLLNAIGVEIAKNEEEGCVVASHPNSDEVIRRTSITACVEAVLRDWVTLK